MKRLALWLLMSAAGAAGLASATAAPPPAAGKDAAALLAQGDTFCTNGQLTEALWAYRQAAKAGNIKAAYAAGELLCRAGASDRGRERILKLSEGLGDLFRAATNRLPQACAALSRALQNGVGVQTNLMAAYAWMELAAEKDHAYKSQLDQLVVQMNPNDVQPAQNLAWNYSHGHWPTDLVRPVDLGDPRLKLKGITITSGGRAAMVILNRVTFTEGDTLEVMPEGPRQHPAGASLTVTCQEIGDDYVLVAIAGESHLKLLSSTDLMQ